MMQLQDVHCGVFFVRKIWQSEVTGWGTEEEEEEAGAGGRETAH